MGGVSSPKRNSPTSKVLTSGARLPQILTQMKKEAHTTSDAVMENARIAA